MPLYRHPLFNQKLIEKKQPIAATPAEHKRLLHDWAAGIRNGSLGQQKETAVRGVFLQRLFHEILGYRPFNGRNTWTIEEEARLGPGSADAALGSFDNNGQTIVAPVELKGADTRDLDAIMPGRHKSPVQQAWEYAMDTPGCSFVVVTNMVEIRLYAVGHTRQAYETWDLRKVADKDSEYQRLRFLLGADNLLSGATARLLGESQQADKEITRALYADYKTWRVNLIIALSQANEGIPFRAILRHAQTILDRMLFIAFAEDRELLPEQTLAQCYTHRNPYQPQPVWSNFQGLFRAIDKGNPELSIPAYNGGLFAADPELDSLQVPDEACAIFKQLGEYDFASEVGVTVLGHIFEQSIEDLEKLRELADTEHFTLDSIVAQEKENARSVTGKRKEHGIVYTPDAITGFIVDQTLGAYLRDRRAHLLDNHLDPRQPTDDQRAPRWRPPTKNEEKLIRGTVKDRAKNIKIDKDRLVPYLFWTAWRDNLAQVRVVDPACGSGAFLIAAFDVLDAEYRQANEQIQALTGSADFFDIDRTILNRNLYGVDLNAESIEITKLSLWLKTAQHGKPLEALEAHLRVGNSLISPADGGGAYSEAPFDWHAAFPDVVADGGFDVVLGNPPYVRMERLKPIKPYLEQRYAVTSDRLDLYGYFYELGVRLLKPGGRLGYISSSTFFKTGSGDALRTWLLNNTQVQLLLDFGDIQVFEGVTTYPAIVVLERCDTPQADTALSYLTLTDTLPDDLTSAFERGSRTLPQAALDRDGWRLEDAGAARLRTKLTRGHPTLRARHGSPLYGIKTGLNAAFVIDRQTRDRLIATDPKSAALLKPFLEGKDLKKWRIEPQDLWLIYIPKGVLEIDHYPAIKAHLLPFKDKLEKRATKQAWFELQQAQAAYAARMAGTKIIYERFMSEPLFCLDFDGYSVNNALNIIPDADWYELGLLTNSVTWFLLRTTGTPMSGGYFQIHGHMLEKLPIPDASPIQEANVARLAEACQRTAETRRDAQAAFRRRIPDLAPGGATARLSGRLIDWWAFDGFKAFQSEIKKQFKQDIPLAERNDWEDWFDRQKTEVDGLSARLAALEAELNQAVYGLFDLDANDIALIEGNIAPDSPPCDHTPHDAHPTPATRPTLEPMARPAPGRGQPAGRLPAASDRIHPQFDGTGERAGGSAAVGSPAGSTQPLNATRALATTAGALAYSEVSERLAAHVADCLDALFDLDPASIRITPEWLRETHRQLADALFPDWAGQFRTTEVQVGTHTPPQPYDVPVRIRDFCLDLEERQRHLSHATSFAALLAWADWRFQWIHPFKDFNGRVGRIMLVALCYSLGLPPIDPAAGDRARYFQALRHADAGHLAPLEALWLERLDTTGLPP